MPRRPKEPAGQIQNKGICYGVQSTGLRPAQLCQRAEEITVEPGGRLILDGFQERVCALFGQGPVGMDDFVGIPDAVNPRRRQREQLCLRLCFQNLVILRDQQQKCLCAGVAVDCLAG